MLLQWMVSCGCCCVVVVVVVVVWFWIYGVFVKFIKIVQLSSKHDYRDGLAPFIAPLSN